MNILVLCFFWKGHSTYHARHTLCGLESSEKLQSVSPLYNAQYGDLDVPSTGRDLRPRFCNHTTSNTHNESQVVKARTDIGEVGPHRYIDPKIGMAKLRSMSRGRENIAQDKKYELSGLTTYVLALPSPRACRGGGIGRADKTCRASLLKS
jgi:hypothetical protein